SSPEDRKMAGSERESFFGSESGASSSSPLHSPSRVSEGGESSTTGGSAAAAASSGVPLQQVRKIVATNPDVLPFTPDGLFALAKVSELFVEHLIRETVGLHDNKVFDYGHLAETIQNDEDLSFLHEFFPTCMTFEEALRRSQEQASEDE
ncbi:hypothetical protein PFISCL1PPCAC_22772, partial [Pristionchus fissidentatus]